MAGYKQYLRINEGVAKTLESLSREDLSRTKELFVFALLQFYRKAASPTVSVARKDLLDKMNELAPRQADTITPSGFTRFINKLKEIDAITETKVAEKKAIFFELNSRIELGLQKVLPTITIMPSAQDLAKQARKQRTMFEESSSILLLDIPYSNYAMRLMHGILHGFVRADRYDHRKTIPKTARRIRLRNREGEVISETIHVKTTSRSDEDSALMDFSDSVIISALNSMYVEGIIKSYGPDPDQKQIPPIFVFDIFDLCDTLGVTRENRKQIALKLQRVRDTMFTLYLKDAPEFRRTFGFGHQDVVEFQYITQFGYATEELVSNLEPVNAEGFRETRESAESDLFGSVTYDPQKGILVSQVPRFYYITFNTYHFSYLIQNSHEHRFSYPPALFNSKNPHLLGQAYSWARGYVGVRPDITYKGPVVLTLDEYRVHIAPVATRETFWKLFKSMVERYLVERGEAYNISGVNLANLMGYYLEVDHRSETLNSFYKRYPSKRPRARGPASRMDAIVKIWRDTEDPFVGDNSIHNQLLRQQNLAFA